MICRKSLLPKSRRGRAMWRGCLYNRRAQAVSFDIFENIGKYLPLRAVLVFNQTKVLPAWLMLKKATGGLAQVLYIGANGNFIRVLANRPLKIGAKLFLKNYFFTVRGREIEGRVADFLNRAKKEGRQIVSLGTTVARALESASTPSGKLNKLSGATDLFVRLGYKLKFIDALTNFHVPKSSLLMLVAALMGREKLLKLYRLAIQNNFRFFSFGDGMLVL